MEKIEKSHHMQKCFWYVIFTGLMMIYDEWAPHRYIILPQKEQIDETRCILLLYLFLSVLLFSFTSVIWSFVREDS